MRAADAIETANALLYGERPKEALAAYEKIVEKAPDERGYCGAAFALFSLNRPEDALKHIKALIRLVPGEAYPHGAMGAALEMAGREEEALACYERMLEIEPDDVMARVRKAAVLRNVGREKESRRCIDELSSSRSQGGISEAQARRIDELGEINSGAKSPGYAMPGFEEMIDVLFGESVGILVGGEDQAASAEYARLMERANRLAGEGRHKEAADALDEVIKDDPDYAEAHSLKGMQLVEAGMHKEAIACVDEVLRIKPDAADDLGVKAMLLERIGCRTEALACYDRLIKVHPGETAAYHLKCSLLADAGDAEGMAKCYREALESEPSDREGAATKKAMRAEYRELERCAKKAGSMEAGFEKFMKKGGVKRQPIWRRGPGKKSRRR